MHHAADRRTHTKAQHAMLDNRIVDEVVIAEDGSADGSIEIVWRLGPRVVAIRARGCGNAWG
jgi:hypothetical protein